MSIAITSVLAACGGSSTPSDAPATTTTAAPASETNTTVSSAASMEVAPAVAPAGDTISTDDKAAMLKSVKSGGADDKVAGCVTDGLAKALTGDEFRQVTKAQKQSDVPPALAEKANAIALDCALGGTGSPTSVTPPAVETTVAEAVQSFGTKDSPVALTTTVSVDNGYDITVNSFNSDATAAVLAANDLNDKPTAGQRYVMVNMTILNSGGDTDKRQPAFDFPLKAVSTAGTAYEGSNCSAVLPDPLPWFSDVFKGSAITGNVCFIVADADATGLKMYVDVYTKSFATFTYYFDLA